MPSLGVLERSRHLATQHACSPVSESQWTEEMNLQNCVLVFDRLSSNVFQALSLHQEELASPTR